MRIIFIVLLFCSLKASAQLTPAELFAHKVALRMKDSLSLTEQQRQQLYQINMSLYSQKAALGSQYSSVDSLRKYMQRIENSRDSLYHTVLPNDKYPLYIQKKKNIVNNN